MTFFFGQFWHALNLLTSKACFVAYHCYKLRTQLCDDGLPVSSSPSWSSQWSLYPLSPSPSSSSLSVLSSTAQGADRTQGGLFDVEIVSLGAAQCSDLPLCAYRSYIKIYPAGVCILGEVYCCLITTCAYRPVWTAAYTTRKLWYTLEEFPSLLQYICCFCFHPWHWRSLWIQCEALEPLYTVHCNAE